MDNRDSGLARDPDPDVAFAPPSTESIQRLWDLVYPLVWRIFREEEAEAEAVAKRVVREGLAHSQPLSSFDLEQLTRNVAVERLAEIYDERMHRAARRASEILPSAAYDADDAVQDAYLNMLERIGRQEIQGALEGYVVGTVKHALFDQLRRQRAKKRPDSHADSYEATLLAQGRELAANDARTESEESVPRSQTRDRAATDDDTWGLLPKLAPSYEAARELLPRLAPQHRAVIEGYFYKDKDFPEMAEELATPLKTVNQVYRSAVKRLRELAAAEPRLDGEPAWRSRPRDPARKPPSSAAGSPESGDGSGTAGGGVSRTAVSAGQGAQPPSATAPAGSVVPVEEV